MRQGPRKFATPLRSTLLLAVSTLVLTQCSAGPQRTETAQPPAAPANPAPEAQRTAGERDHGRQRDEHEDEESARVKSVARALRTIAADPERSRTYGFPP